MMFKHISDRIAGRLGKPHPEVFIELRDQNNSVHYRNIWVRTLGTQDKP